MFAQSSLVPAGKRVEGKHVRTGHSNVKKKLRRLNSEIPAETAGNGRYSSPSARRSGIIMLGGVRKQIFQKAMAKEFFGGGALRCQPFCLPVAGLHSVDTCDAKGQRMFAQPFARGRATLFLSVACRCAKSIASN